MDTLFLASTSTSNVHVHPLVILNILDHYIRRPAEQVRVIGTLLGYTTETTTEITNSFAVMHREKDDEVALDKDGNKQMCSLMRRVNNRERVVGWYATTFDGIAVVENSCLIHEYYTQESNTAPVHLVVDTSLCNDKVDIKGYVSSPLTVDEQALANHFQEVKVQLKMTEAARIAVHHMLRGDGGEDSLENGGLTTVDGDMQQLESAMQRLLEMLQSTGKYVDNVISGKVEADGAIGHQIAETIAAVPRIRPELFDKIFNSNVRDILMVTYLSNLTRAQLAITEKLMA